MASPKAIRFARAMALLSPALPIPAVAVSGALVACESGGGMYEHPVGLERAPERPARPEVPAEAGAPPTTPGSDAGELAPTPERPVGTQAGPEHH